MKRNTRLGPRCAGALLVALALLCPSTFTAAQAQQRQDLRSQDWISPLSFIIIQEAATGEPREFEQHDPLVDRGSLILITLREDVLDQIFHRVRSGWLGYAQTEAFQFYRRELRREDLPADQRRRILELKAALEAQYFIEAPAIDLGIRATVYPKEGPSYEVEVPGYTRIIIQNPAPGETDDEVGEQTLSIRTVRRDRRLFRIERDPLIEEDDAPEALRVSDELTRDIVLNLSNLALSEGDRLEIEATNYYRGSERSFVWDLHIRDMGIHFSQSPSLLLVKGFGRATSESSGESGDTEELESNFKPAPGTSFLLSWKSRSRVWNTINPALGLNASFVDFRNDKDLEIGLGPVLSLLNGIVQVNVGWNLTVEEDRFFWAIGLGFLDLANKVGEVASDE